MSDLFRETSFGHAVRWLTGGKVLRYPEERTDFKLPPEYSASDGFMAPRGDGQFSQENNEDIEGQGRIDVEEAFHDSRSTEEKFQIIVLSDGTVLVDWYSSDDPANPQNWSGKKKSFVATQIWYAFKLPPASARSYVDMLVASIHLQSTSHQQFTRHPNHV